MARKSKTHDVRVVRYGFSDRKVRRLVACGWEIVDSHGGSLMTAKVVTLRKPRHEESTR